MRSHPLTTALVAVLELTLNRGRTCAAYAAGIARVWLLVDPRLPGLRLDFLLEVLWTIRPVAPLAAKAVETTERMNFLDAEFMVKVATL